jgi:ribonuclease P protein component
VPKAVSVLSFLSLQSKTPLKSFPKSARLRNRADYLRLFGDAKKKSLRCCVVFFKPSTTDRARLGITVKLRIGAVKRNLLRRQIRESFRLKHTSLPAIDYNVVVSKPVEWHYTLPERVRQVLDGFWEDETHPR